MYEQGTKLLKTGFLLKTEDCLIYLFLVEWQRSDKNLAGFYTIFYKMYFLYIRVNKRKKSVTKSNEHK